MNDHRPRDNIRARFIVPGQWSPAPAQTSRHTRIHDLQGQTVPQQQMDLRLHRRHTTRWARQAARQTRRRSRHRIHGVQIVPMVARDARHLYVCSAHPPFIDSRGNAPIEPGGRIARSEAGSVAGWKTSNAILAGLPTNTNLVR